MKTALFLLLLGSCGGDTPPAPVPDPPAQADGRPVSGLVVDVTAERTWLYEDQGEKKKVVGYHARGDGALVGSRVEGTAVGDELTVKTATPVEALPAGFKAGGYTVTGKVIRVDGDAVVLDHDRIPGVMGAMVMPFKVGDKAILGGLAQGDLVRGRLLVLDWDYTLIALEKTGASEVTLRGDIPQLLTNELLPRTEVRLIDGTTVVVGEGQDRPTLLTFLYTRCPDPKFCPATAARLQALQESLPEGHRILAVTLDPDFDSDEVLAKYGEGVGAKPGLWTFGRLEGEALKALALRAGLAVTVQDGKISHQTRFMVLDGGGRLMERYDDNAWPEDRMVAQLTHGAPRAKPGLGGTLFETPDDP
jgi:protein SCO1/2